MVLVLAVLVGATAVRAGADAVTALAGGSAAMAVLPPAIAAPAPPPVHVVRAGDTYWSIAVSLGRPGDVRAVVDELVAANGHRALQPGDRLTLPVP
jgi:LysM repeat protein